jgi:twitching motility protein PilJ
VATNLSNSNATAALLTDELAEQWQRTRNLERGFVVAYAESGQFLIALNEHITPWRSSLEGLRVQLNTLSDVSDQRVARILTGLDDYEVQVDAAVELRRERSQLVRTVRNGELQAAFAAAERPTLEMMALLLRQHQNGYLQSGEGRYIRDFNTQAAALREGIVADIPEAERDTYLALLATTTETFDALQALDGAVADATISYQRAVQLVDRTLTALTENAIADTEQLQQRLADVSQRTLITVVPLLLLVAIVAWVLATTLANNLTRQVATLQKTVEAANRGDLSARSQVINRDELGGIASRLNAWLDALARRALTDQEENALQQALMVLLDDVSSVAMGDLSAEADTSDELTGNVAVAFNGMTHALQRIIAQVQTVTLQFSRAADAIESNSTTLAERSATQAEQILNTSVAVDEMSVSIQQVAHNTLRSAQVAEKARNDAQIGAAAVRKTLAEMQGIEQDVAETQEYVQTLNRNAWQIDDIIELIDEIADRTSVLALNATIRALAAGEAGRGFAVVAREVESLADQSAKATKRVAKLVSAVRDEAEAAQSAMTLATETVRMGRGVADSAETRLSDIENVTTQLDTLLQQIRLATQQQAQNSTTVAKSMDNIANVTQQTAAGTRETSLSIRNLAQLADQLRESVTRFRADVVTAS